MAEQFCPVCGCPVDENSYEKDGDYIAVRLVLLVGRVSAAAAW